MGMLNNLLNLILSSAAGVVEGESAGHGLTLALGIICLALAGAISWALSKLNATKQELTQKQAAFDELAITTKNLRSEINRTQTQNNEKSQTLAKLKKDFQEHKKKHHLLQEEFKNSKVDFQAREQKLERKLELAAHPISLAEPPKGVDALDPDATKQAELSKEILKLQKQVEELANVEESKNSELKGIKNKLNTEKREHGELRKNLKGMKSQVEKYRRIDIISKNKLELIEDKLLTMGRKYYDALSDLAATNGAVVPPKPATLLEAEARASEKAMLADNLAEHDDHEGETEANEEELENNAADVAALSMMGEEGSAEKINPLRV